MRRVGEVIQVTQGLAVVRSPDGEFPDIGTPVVNQRLETVGRVVDAFGPTERPYLAVSRGDAVAGPATLLGTVLYAR